MVSDAITIFLGVDTTQLDAELMVTQGKIDSVVSAWQNHRREIMMSLGIVNQMIGIVSKIASKVTDELGKAMLKMVQSLLAVVNATVSAMIAVAAGYASTGVLAPIGAAVAAFAAGLGIGQSIAISIVEAQLIADLMGVNTRLSTVERQQQAASQFRSMMGAGI